MRQFVESLKRLYKSNKTNDIVISRLFEESKITKDERDYILNIRE